MKDVDEYQRRTSETAIYPGHEEQTVEGLMYLALKLASEAGEIAGKVGKAMRDADVRPHEPVGGLSLGWRRDIGKELGDIAWYTAQTAKLIDLLMSEVLAENLDKLEDRKERGALGGSGDDR